MEVPDLLDLQIDSFDWLIGNDAWRDRVETALDQGRTDINTKSGLEEIFEEISPIEDFSGTTSLSFRDHRFEPPKNTVDECKERDVTYAAPLFVTAEFMNNETGEIKSQTVFMGDFPLMTDKGTFVINGTERVVVSQLVRSPGVYFEQTTDKTSDKDIFTCNHGPFANNPGDPDPRKALLARIAAGFNRSLMLTHWYHHRGQLVVYFRCMGIPVPAIYGRSADETLFGA